VSSYSVVLDSVSVASGNSVLSDEVDLFLHDTLSLEIVGDGDSTDLDASVQARLIQGESFGEYDATFEGQDLTKSENNKVIVPYDVSDVNDARVEITNNGSSSTSVTVKAGKTRGVQQ
jgi:hypothetical protein